MEWLNWRYLCTQIVVILTIVIWGSFREIPITRVNLPNDSQAYPNCNRDPWLFHSSYNRPVWWRLSMTISISSMSNKNLNTIINALLSDESNYSGPLYCSLSSF